MATEYNIYSYLHGINGYGRQFCDTIYNATLSATTDTSLTVPGTAAIGAFAASVNNKFLAVIRYSAAATIYFAVNATAAAPSGASFASATSIVLGASTQGIDGFVVKAGDVLHFYSTGTPSISVELYAIQE